MRNEVKDVENYNDAICCNCINYNDGQCTARLPFMEVAADNRCTDHGGWMCKDKLHNLRGVCLILQTHPVVTKISNLICENCISYYPVKSECHFRRAAVYKVLPDDFCGDGCWLYSVAIENEKETKEEIIMGGPEYIYEAISNKK